MLCDPVIPRITSESRNGVRVGLYYETDLNMDQSRKAKYKEEEWAKAQRRELGQQSKKGSFPRGGPQEVTLENNEEEVGC